MIQEECKNDDAMDFDGENEDQLLGDASEIQDKFSHFHLVYSRDQSTLKLSNFQVMAMIGKGSISNVYLIKRNTD